MGQSRSPLDVAGLELLAARGWRGTEQDSLGDWLLRAGGGFTGRANSALVVGDPGLPLRGAVDAVARWYADRGLRACAQLPGRQSRAADTAFAAAGWERDEDVLVLTGPLTPTAADGVPVGLSPEPDDAWLAGYRHRGRPLPPAARRGARWVYLQVAASNAPARALYRRAGLIEHHRYHYRYAPD